MFLLSLSYDTQGGKKSAFDAFLGMALPGFIYPQATMVLKWFRSTMLDLVCFLRCCLKVAE